MHTPHPAAGPGRHRTPRLLASVRPYRRAWWRPDVVAGLTVWAVLVPEAFAYATIAGVPPVVGLYAAVPALVLYALAGSSRHLVVGPMSATAALSAAVVAPLAGGDPARVVVLTTALALATGVVGVVAGLLRLGVVAAFISEPVLKGFVVGLALTIVVGQVPALLGVDKGGDGFVGEVAHVVGALGDVDPLTAGVGLGALALVVLLRRVAPVVPASLVVVLGGILLVELGGLAGRLDVVGQIAPGLPAVGVPSVAAADWADLLPAAGGVLVVGFAEGLGAAKTYAARAGYRVDANRELLALGLANAGAGLSSGMVVNGSLSKTAVNGAAGARTQVSGLVVAALSLVTLLVLTPVFEPLPEAVLAAVVIGAVIELVDVRALRDLYGVWTARLGASFGRTARADFLGAVVALLGVLLLGTLRGLLLGILASLLLLLLRTSAPPVRRLVRVDGRWVDAGTHPDAGGPQHAAVLRVEAPLHFANADRVRDEVLRAADDDPGVGVVVVDLGAVPTLDVTAARTLAEAASSLAGRGVDVRLASAIGTVRDVVRLTDTERRLGLHADVDAALARAPRA